MPRHLRPSCPRSGAVLLEFLLVFPLLLIGLLVLVELGLIFGGMKQLALSSRVGGRAAARLSRPTITNAASLPPDIKSAVNQQLQSTGIGTACRVTLQHSVDHVGVNALLDDPTPSCNCPAPTNNFPPNQEYVRVTVCVELSQLTPDLLSVFGFSTAGRQVMYSATYRFED